MAAPRDRSGLRPAEQVLAASIARRFYLDGRSKSEIAAELGLSRFKVARILDAARETGLVRIEIGFPGIVDAERSGRLRDAYRLHHAIVVDTPDDGHLDSLRQHLAETTADLLGELVVAEDVLGVAWSRTLAAMSKSLTRLAPCTVVQLNGALSRPDVDEHSVDLVRAVARTAGGPAFPFYAPFLVPDAEVARVLRRQPEVAAALSRFDSLTKAVVAIGSWDPPRSTVYDAVEEGERQALRELAVRGELCGVFFDDTGKVVAPPLLDRMIGVSADQLRRIPEVIAVAYGTDTAAAVRAALRGRLVSSLVTHTTLADALLDAGIPEAAGRAVPG